MSGIKRLKSILEESGFFHGTTHYKGCGCTSRCRCSTPHNEKRDVEGDCPLHAAGVKKKKYRYYHPDGSQISAADAKTYPDAKKVLVKESQDGQKLTWKCTASGCGYEHTVDMEDKLTKDNFKSGVWRKGSKVSMRCPECRKYAKQQLVASA